MPELSNWKMPSVSPFWNTLKVLASSRLMFSRSMAVPSFSLTSRRMFLMMVRVFRPRMSIFSRPIFSTSSFSKWVVMSSLVL